MTRSNAFIANMVGGELSSLTHGRTDLPIYKRGVERAENWVLTPQGPAQFRAGSRFVHRTRLNQIAVLIPFQFNDSQAYQIEATEGYFRFYKDNSIITETPIPTTGVILGPTTTITYSPSAVTYANGDEVFLDSIVGPTFLNGQSYLVANATATTFDILDSNGNPIISTGQPTYVSGGQASRIYEIRTPYRVADLLTLQFAQNTDTMYIDHRNYEPRKLTRSGHANWSLNRYVRQADPFETAKAITGVTTGTTTTISSPSNGHAVGDRVYIDSLVGPIALNNRHYLVGSVPNGNSFTITDYAGNAIDSTSYGSYTSGGFVETIEGNSYPRAVAFTADARTVHGGTNLKPETILGSCAPTGDGVRYDNFTIGVNATDAFQFTLAPVDGQSNAIQWLNNTDKFLVAGTFGTVRRIYGATEAEAVSPTGINAKSVSNYGAAQSSSVPLGSSLFYIQRGMQGVRSLDYDYTIDGYLTTDRNLVADHMPYPGLQQLVFQQGKPDVIWSVRTDGILLGLTYKDKEDISGWHRHKLGGSHIDNNGITRRYGRVLSVGAMPRPSAQDQLWLVVERQVNGRTLRTVEFLTDYPIYPDMNDFFTGDKTVDLPLYNNAKYEAQKQSVHLDCSLTYDGSSYAAGDLTFTGSSVSASVATFTPDMVGRSIWGRYDVTGNGGGQATITAYTSPTLVTVSIAQPFPTVKILAGKWALTTTRVSGLRHLEGQTVGINTDGGPHIDAVVSNGTVNLAYPASVVTVGLKYVGILKTLSLDTGGVTGSAQNKPKNIEKTIFHVINSGGISFGSDIYDLQPLVFRDALDLIGRPVPVRTGVYTVTCPDGTESLKNVVVVQDQAMPCTIIVMDVYVDTSDE